MRSSRARARRSISAAWKACSSRHAAAGSSRSRNVARRTKAANSAVPMPARWAPAAVGHSVPHQRRRSAAARTGQRGRGPRGPCAPGRRPPAPSCWPAPGWPARRRCPPPRRARRAAKPSRWRVAGGGPEPLGLLGELGAQQRPRLALEQLALDGQQQRLGRVPVRARRPAGPAARRGSSRTAGARRRRDRARCTAPRSSGKCSARCSRSTSRIQPALGRRGEAGSARAARAGRPAARSPAISQRTARRSKRNSAARCQASSATAASPPRTAAYSRRVAGVSAPRRTSTVPSASR